MSAAISLSDHLAGIEPPSSLDALLRQTEGADLRSVAEALSAADTPWAARILDELVASPNGAIAQGEGLPLPHPCDAESASMRELCSSSRTHYFGTAVLATKSFSSGHRRWQSSWRNEA